MSSALPEAARVLHVSACAAERVQHTARYLAQLPTAARALILVPNAASGLWLAAQALQEPGARFGWQRASLEQHARTLALPALLASGRSQLGKTAAHALCARVLHALGERGQLGRFAAVSSQPGFAHALSRSLCELRLAEVSPDAVQPHAPELARCLAAYEAALQQDGLVDDAGLYALAAESARSTAHLVALDVPVAHAAAARLLCALARSAQSCWASLPLGDAASLEAFRSAWGAAEERSTAPRAPGELGRLQARLFTGQSQHPQPLAADAPASVRFISAPGESRECVEVARELLAAASSGVRFDRMAVLVRAVDSYRAVLEEALARAAIPAHFAAGVQRPAPEGRAFALLLACADGGLSARRFAEYLSLSVVPGSGAEPPSPRQWERFLTLAAVGGDSAHWRRRLRGLDAQWRAELPRLPADDPQRLAREQQLAALEALGGFALPLLERLEQLPRRASFQRWRAELAALADAALSDPTRVHELLAELSALGDHTELGLRELRRLLAPHLCRLLVTSEGGGAGKLFVGEVDEARGRSFERVFVLGLAEKLFPPRLLEDPLLPDRVRARISPALERMPERVARERLSLRLAAGAASEQLRLTFPRYDTEHGRPRVPSFYGLEALEAMYGALPGWSELTERADPGAAARLGWPAPGEPERAIDDAEYDLSVVASVHGEGRERAGALHYLLTESPHLARALRFRARRWELQKLVPADGFVVRDPRAQELLAAYLPAARSYSPSSLAQLAICPYRFYLRAIARVATRELPPAFSELDPRERGVLFHEVQRRTLEQLRAAPGTDPAQALEAALAEVQRDAHARFAPPLPRVFDSAFQAMRRDLSGWIGGQAAERQWQPEACELQLGGDEPADARVPHVVLRSGLRLSGAIDLVERTHGEPPGLRATDWKTGALPEQLRGITQGGHVLQPLLYALALERMFPEAQVSGGRLYFCTHAARYKTFEVPLSERAREAADVLQKAASDLIGNGLLAAAPESGACERCDYRAICGPHEEERVTRVKQRDLGAQLRSLQLLRRLP